MTGLYQRLQDQQRASLEIIVDGDRLQVLDGDTLLTAILLHRPHLRLNEIGDEPRSGFCLMGACQDCWVGDAAGNRLRACTTYVRAGLEIVTGIAAEIAAATQPVASVPAMTDDVTKAAPPTEATSNTTESDREAAEDLAEDDPAEEGHS